MGIDDGYRRIGPDPFRVPPSRRDPARRLRGRLVAPVTVWTAYAPANTPAGITVSSVLVAEGEPAEVIGLVGPVSDFWEAVVHSRRFMIHVLEAHQVEIADRFALRYPGDPFDGISVTASESGPVLSQVATRASCVLSGYMEAGYFLLVRGILTSTEIGDLVAPLARYRSRYLTTAARLK